MSDRPAIEKLFDYKSQIASQREKATVAVHKMSKYTARERLAALFDENSFVETNAFVKCANGAADEAVVTGYGAVAGRLVFAFAQDPVVDGGAMSEKAAKKICAVVDMAVENQAPVVAVLDSNGGRVTEGVALLNAYGTVLCALTKASGSVPVIAAVAGTCAGVSTLIAKTADFVVMSAEKGEMFINSPAVLKATGTKVPENVGTADFALENGYTSIVAANEGELFAKVRQLINYLPQNYLDGTDVAIASDDAERVDYALLDNSDTRSVLNSIADFGSILELSASYATEITTAFIRLNGAVVGAVANTGASITSASAKKAAKFISFCDAYSIPVLTLVDTDSFEFGVESGCAVSNYTALSAAYASATTAKVTLITGKAYGSAYIAMGSKSLGADIVYALPTAQISVMEPSAAATFLMEEKLADSKNPIEDRAKLIAEYTAEFASPYKAAFEGLVDNVISPESTRAYIVSAVEALAFKNKIALPKKHTTVFN